MCVVESNASEMSFCSSPRNEVTSSGRPNTIRVNETRKIRKPLMEKKRRARINESLNTLKIMLMEANKQIAADGRPAKLEKADILELTVQHLQQLHRQCDIAKSETEKENEINSTCSKSSLNTNNINNSNINPIMERLTVTTAHQNTNNINKTYHLKVRIPNGITLLPTKLSNGDFAFILPAEMSQEMFRQCCGDLQPTKNHSVQTNEQIWRPW